MAELKTYTLPDYGECAGIEYEFCGRRYVQLELLTPTVEKLGEWVTDLNLANVSSFMDVTAIHIGALLSALLKQGAMASRFLATVLVRDDLTPCSPDEFRVSRFVLFAPFVKAVVSDFFSLNGELLGPMLDAVKDKVLAPIKLLAELLPSLTSLLQSQVAAPQKSPLRVKRGGRKS